MAIPLNRELLRNLIERRFGSIDGLVVAWEERVASGAQKVGRARSRAALYRWLDKGLPSNRDDLFGFAAVLDVDPVALVNLTEGYIRQHFGKARRLFHLGHANQSQLSGFWAIYVPGPGWPNAEVSYPFYGRPWCTADFIHDLTVKDVYAAISLRSTEAGESLVPRTYHFAYRSIGNLDEMWRTYGTVIGYDGEVCLLMENGRNQRQQDARSPPMIVAETWFGPGSAEFRVASLHGFGVTVQTPSDEARAIRFQA